LSYKREMFSYNQRKYTMYGPFVVLRCDKNGGPLLVDEPNRIRDIQGFMLTLGKPGRYHQFMFVFRKRKIG
jgi:hypothetical protein